MPDRLLYDYAIIRVVPKVDREEFINVGAIVSCGTKKFLEARIEIDEKRLRAIDSTLDLELISDHLAVIPLVCAGGPESGAIGQLPHRERFHWLVAPRSTIVQTSRVHTGLCENLPSAIEHLLDTMVR